MTALKLLGPICNRSHTCISFKPPQDHCY